MKQERFPYPDQKDLRLLAAEIAGVESSPAQQVVDEVMKRDFHLLEGEDYARISMFLQELVMLIQEGLSIQEPTAQTLAKFKLTSSYSAVANQYDITTFGDEQLETYIIGMRLQLFYKLAGLSN